MERKIINKILLNATETGADLADLFIENTISNNIVFIDGKIDKVITSILNGVGLRAVSGENTYYAYSNLIDEDRLINMASSLAALISGKRRIEKINFEESKYENKHPILKYPRDVSSTEKKEMLIKIDKAARSYSNLISQVEIVLMDEVQSVEIANSNGKHIHDERVRIRLVVKAIARKEEIIEFAVYNKIAAQKGYELLDEYDLEEAGIEAAKRAIAKLNAKECPSGEMPVIIGNGFGGVIFHEACVHALEADSLVHHLSIFDNKLNKKIARNVVTIIDDGTISNMWGSSNIDDEGNSTARNVLIEKGVLKSYLVDECNGKRINMKPTGSSRRENYKYITTARMNNTHLMNGESTLEEMIKSISNGLYVKEIGGGSVNPSTGDFNFATTEAYIIRNGRLGEQVKGASLIGNGAEVLMNVEMVGNDFDYGIGRCGSISGSIPVTVGQPSIKVSKMTVGGRKKDD